MPKLVKQGLIFVPPGDLPWALRYATVPTPIVLGDCIRIYFASLDENSWGRISYIDVDRNDPQRIIHVHSHPILDLGETGAFDDSGVNASCVLEVGGQLWMYYIGWQRCERVPYMLFSGLARSTDGGDFVRNSRVPVLDRTDHEPFSRSGPFVMRQADEFRMWYWSCVGWSTDGDLLHYNNEIRYATSRDGVQWTTDPHVCIAPQRPEEYAVGRPWVVHDADRWRMWFSIRSFTSLYTIGYAESMDGIHWERISSDVLPRSESGWDSEMVCYPAVIDSGERRLLFYNGNRHGLSGFGYASIE